MSGLDRSGAIVLNIAGQVMQNLASVLMSRGQQETPEGKTHKFWWVGIALLVPGALAVFASYGAAEQSLLGSLISVQFVSNVIFSRLFLGRLVSPKLLGGTTIIISGTLLCIVNAPKSERELDEHALQLLYFDNHVFLRFLVCEALVWILIDKIYSFYQEAFDDGDTPRGLDLLLPSTFVARAALPGSYSIVAAKTLAVLLKLTMSGRNMLGESLLWLSLFLWIGGTAFWMRRMNDALARFDGAFVVPLCQVNWSFFTIMTGGFFFREFEHFELEELMLFNLGVCANFVGVSLLLPTKVSSSVVQPSGTDGEDIQVEPQPHIGELDGQAMFVDIKDAALGNMCRQRPQSLTSTAVSEDPSVMERNTPIPSEPSNDLTIYSQTISTMGMIPLVFDAKRPRLSTKTLPKKGNHFSKTFSQTANSLNSGALGSTYRTENSATLRRDDMGSAVMDSALLEQLKRMEEMSIRRDEELRRMLGEVLAQLPRSPAKLLALPDCRTLSTTHNVRNSAAAEPLTPKRICPSSLTERQVLEEAVIGADGSSSRSSVGVEGDEIPKLLT